MKIFEIGFTQQDLPWFSILLVIQMFDQHDFQQNRILNDFDIDWSLYSLWSKIVAKKVFLI